MLSLRIKGSRPRDPTTDPSWIARGLHPLGALAGTLRLRHQSLSTPCASAWDSGARPSPRLPIEGSMDPILSSFLAFGSSKGPGSRQTPRATKARGLPGTAPRARRCQPLFRKGHALGVTQEAKLLHQPRGLQGFWARVSAPKPAVFATKKPPEGASGEEWSKPTQPDIQRVRT